MRDNVNLSLRTYFLSLLMNMKFTFVVLLFSCFQLNSQQARDFAKGSVSSSKAWIDVDYVGDGIIGHKMDVFLPVSKDTSFPLVVTIYGSAWLSNSSKSAIFNDGLGQKLLAKGYAVASLNHRSSTDAAWPAQLHDVKAAIRFIRSHAADLLIDTSFIGITGYSSGGHLSTMSGVTSNVIKTKIGDLNIDLEGNEGTDLSHGSHVDAVVDWFGPTDFLIMDSCGSSFSHNDLKSPESRLIGGAIQENKANVALANPIQYINKRNPPFLIFHGTQDPLVPYCESQKLYSKMKQEGVEAEFVMIEGGKHGPGVMTEPYYDRMIDFFNKVRKSGSH